MTLADRIVVMKAGIVQQVAAPEELYNRPANLVRGRFHRLARNELHAPARSAKRTAAPSL